MVAVLLRPDGIGMIGEGWDDGLSTGSAQEMQKGRCRSPSVIVSLRPKREEARVSEELETQRVQGNTEEELRFVSTAPHRVGIFYFYLRRCVQGSRRWKNLRALVSTRGRASNVRPKEGEWTQRLGTACRKERSLHSPMDNSA